MKFGLGRVVATPAALRLLEEAGISPSELLSRHWNGDWGDLDEEDRQANEAAVAHEWRVFSAYEVGDDKVWIITEADRSATTILLPSDY